MNAELILFPLYAMVLLTLYVTMRLGKLRVKAVLEDGLRASYFRLNRGGEPPQYMLRCEQHYENLFESPILFYVAILVIYVGGAVSVINLALAWVFVVLRLGHAYVHMGENRLFRRRKVFIWSIVALYALWTSLLIESVLKFL